MSEFKLLLNLFAGGGGRKQNQFIRSTTIQLTKKLNGMGSVKLTCWRVIELLALSLAPASPPLSI